jgi:adenylate cyclase
MKITTLNKERLKSVAYAAVYGIFVGIAIVFVLVPKLELIDIFEGVIIGLLIGSMMGIFENFISENKLKRMPFVSYILVKSLIYSLIILCSMISVLWITSSVIDRVNIFNVYSESARFSYFIERGTFFKGFIYSMLVSSVFWFLVQINRMLGRGVLLSFVTGRYHKPLEEERIFMFLDLKSSTTLAELLGPHKYSSFLKDFFFDITAPVIESSGKIFQYIGDEVVLVWNSKQGFKNNNFLRSFFKMKQKIHENKDYYMKNYSAVPEFKCGSHIGNVVVTEIGEFRKDIVYHGDTINTASRIQLKSKELQKEFLISGDLLKRIGEKLAYEAEYLGKFQLRGKKSELDLYSVSERFAT